MSQTKERYMRFERVRLGVILLLTSILNVGVVNAKGEEIVDSLASVWKQMHELLSNEYIQFGASIIILTIMVRAIFAAGLKRVPIFGGSGGEGINKFGNTVSWSLSLLSSLAIVYNAPSKDIGSLVSRILGPYGMYVGVVLGVALFIWIRQMTGGRNNISLMLGGLGCIVISNLTSKSAVSFIGVLMIIAGALMFMGGKRRVNYGQVERDLKREEKATQGLEDEAKKEIKLDEKLEAQEEFNEKLSAAEDKIDMDLLKEGDVINKAINAILSGDIHGKEKLVEDIEHILHFEKNEIEKKIDLDERRIKNSEAITKWEKWEEKREERLERMKKNAKSRLEREIGKKNLDSHLEQYDRNADHFQKLIHDTHDKISSGEKKIEKLSKDVEDLSKAYKKKIEEQFGIMNELRYVHNLKLQNRILANLKEAEAGKKLIYHKMRNKEKEMEEIEKEIHHRMEGTRELHLKLMSFLRKKEVSEKQEEKIIDETF